MAAQENTEPTFNASKPKTLFRGNYVTGYAENPEWDISPDGKRFLMMKHSINLIRRRRAKPKMRRSSELGGRTEAMGACGLKMHSEHILPPR